MWKIGFFFPCGIFIILLRFAAFANNPTEQTCPIIEKVDAAVQKGNRLHLFRYFPWQSATISPAEQSGVPDSIDNLNWTAMARPPGAWEPILVFSGTTHNIFVVEQANKRIWQLDRNLQLLTSLPAPDLPNGHHLSDYTVYLTDDKRFTFVHNTLRNTMQFREMGGKLKLLQTQNISIQIDRCMAGQWRHTHDKQFDYKSFPFLCNTSQNLIAYDRLLSKKVVFAFDSLATPKLLTSPVRRVRPMLIVQNHQLIQTFKIDSLTLLYNAYIGTLELCAP